jgi:hypothetical protein
LGQSSTPILFNYFEHPFAKPQNRQVLKVECYEPHGSKEHFNLSWITRVLILQKDLRENGIIRKD